MTLTSKQRAVLRKEANGLTPVFQVGKAGIDTEITKSVKDCIAKRELIKLKLLETCPLSPREAAEELAEASGAQVVQVIGRVVVLFLKKKKESAFDAILKKV